jgi:drug/metabolite transporter (DMT)-like permease
MVVNLINYLWPALTVVFAVLWVPGTRLTGRLVVAILLSLAGLILANFEKLRDLDQATTRSPWPYILALTAAVVWAFYSSMLSRCKEWANRYRTAPLGFLLVSAAATIIGLSTGQWRMPQGTDWLAIAGTGLIPWGIGYMLWELALHRAPPAILGMLAATIPVTSTLVLCLTEQQWPGLHLLAGAFLMSSAVALTVNRRASSTETNPRSTEEP